jgi:hypothetical protein
MAAIAAGLIIVSSATAASPDPKDLAIPPAEMAKARELVKQLASEVFKEREQAQDELAKMGRLARPALTEALTSDPSPEIRTRALRLMPRAEAADLQAHIETFLADTEGKFEHDLPGWSLFRKEAVTKDEATAKGAREIYVEAIKTPANLELLSYLYSPEAAGRAIADRRMTLFLQQNPGIYGRIPGQSLTPRQPTLADVSVLLLAESVVDSKYIAKSNQFGYITAAQFLQSGQSMQALNNPDGSAQSKAYRQLFVKWIDTRVSPDDLNSVAWMANNFRQIKETGTLLKRILTTDGVQPHAKAQAMIYLMQRGKEEAPAIRAMLKNDTNLNNGRIQIAKDVFIDTQLRDIALALLLHSDGQDLKKFGFEFQPGFNMNQVAVNYWGYGFKSDDDRKAALKKFEEYEATKKDKKDEPKK